MGVTTAPMKRRVYNFVHTWCPCVERVGESSSPVMLALKAFVHESVQTLDDAKLQRLSETLRVDLRGCEDRRDIERIVTGLLCLDQDTSLGASRTLHGSISHALYTAHA